MISDFHNCLMIRMLKFAHAWINARCTSMKFFGSGLDPGSNGIADPDWGSGSREAKIPPTPQKKDSCLKNFLLGSRLLLEPDVLCRGSRRHTWLFWSKLDLNPDLKTLVWSKSVTWEWAATTRKDIWAGDANSRWCRRSVMLWFPPPCTKENTIKNSQRKSQNYYTYFYPRMSFIGSKTQKQTSDDFSLKLSKSYFFFGLSKRVL